MKIKKAILLILIIIFPLIAASLFLIFSVNRSYTVFPGINPDQIFAFDDGLWNGNSTVDYFYVESESIQLKFTINSGATDPMIFMNFNPKTPGKIIDLSGYSYLLLNIPERTCKDMTIYIKTFLPGVSRSGGENAVTLRHNKYLLFLEPGIETFRIDLEDFNTPNWWIGMMGLTGKDLPTENYKQVADFQFQFSKPDLKSDKGVQEYIRIEKISLHKVVNSFIPGIALFIFIWYAVFLVLFFILLFRKKNVVNLPIVSSLPISSVRDGDLKRIMKYIQEHYHDPEISTKMIYNALGIASNKINHLLKEQFNLTFKQFINKLRIMEAMRLLKETERTVIDIAFALGFNDISYFNKLFKQDMGSAPLEYRHKHRKKLT